MVGTSSLRQRAEGVAALVASRELVALRLESATRSALVIERNWLRDDFLFLGGRNPRVRELFRGNAVELLLQRGTLKAEAARADVVAAPWKYFESGPHTLKWHRMLSAQLEVAPTLAEQLGRVRSNSRRRDLDAAAADRSLGIELSHSPRDFDRFYAQLYAPFMRRHLGPNSVIESRDELGRDFDDGGVLVLATRKGKLISGALLLTHRRQGLLLHRTGFSQTAGLKPRELAGRVAALELAVIRYAQEEKFGWIDFGDTSSVLTDPQFIDRRLLGCRFVPTAGSPPLMLDIGLSLRPAFFAASPLVTGDPGAFVAQTGFPRTAKAAPVAARKLAAEFSGAGIERFALSTDAPRSSPARVSQEKALRLGAGPLEVQIDEVSAP